MAQARTETVDQYIASRPEEAQRVLRQLRKVLRAALPGSEEVISYQIPAYRLPGGTVLYFGGWKQHTALYPASKTVFDKFQKELERYKLSRGTIQFPLSEPLPLRLIERIAQFRAKEVAARQKAKAAAKTRGAR
jgi:uncharacterized protein YdhG (YjbR/CyaY superfamily)